ncbi:glycogen synthase GlgA [Limimaricola pyoseonensis]|uniref:Glycogen synthase n=1 Tax=Limimaricola pyoseonensis TaxID=521013 RepID=A0A1G6ZLN1_9RHOB|nr:glycogen synthase GlgA [Limimaricola pyoseonensis]SDE02705.1 starch synthase [Limimaricola pyoseonensis]
MTAVLSVASECAPLVKTGGLADVVGALPEALRPEGVSMRVLLPGYPAVLEALETGATAVMTENDLFGGPARVLAGRAAELDLLVLDAPHLYERAGSIYLGPDGRDWPDNPQRFAALSWIAARIAAEGIAPGGESWRPDTLHCHDWQAGLAPDYLAQMSGGANVRTVMTVHNIAFQGLFEPHLIEALRLPRHRFTTEGFEYYGRVSALKAGLVAADRLTTVSPTYAAELLRPDFGMGLDGVLRARRRALTGILNGIDETAWSPASDPHIARTYRLPARKRPNKAALQAEMGLPDAPGPLCCVVSRLTDQKGIDLLLEALPALLDRGGQLALLGSGDPALERALREAAHDPNVSVRIGYDEALSHRLIAGADAILVPSRFEPCGLTQLYGLRYGTVPLVALTGGLADTVIHASPAAIDRGVATGVQFHPVDAAPLAVALDRLCDLYARPDIWAQMQRNAMKQPVGWSVSAKAYAALYRDATAEA